MPVLASRKGAKLEARGDAAAGLMQVTEMLAFKLASLTYAWCECVSE